MVDSGDIAGRREQCRPQDSAADLCIDAIEKFIDGVLFDSCASLFDGRPQLLLEHTNVRSPLSADLTNNLRLVVGDIRIGKHHELRS